jgi:hypothetical protein
MTDNDERMTAEQLTAEVRRVMALVGEDAPAGGDDTALVAAWPDPVLRVPEKDREQRVTRGSDTMIFDDPESGRRGFVRAVLRVPLGHAQGQTYGVFVEVDREGYGKLKQAFRDKAEVRVWGKLATRLPLLEDAYMSEVEVVEDGSDRRARVTGARHEAILHGPKIGP